MTPLNRGVRHERTPAPTPSINPAEFGSARATPIGRRSGGSLAVAHHAEPDQSAGQQGKRSRLRHRQGVRAVPELLFSIGTDERISAELCAAVGSGVRQEGVDVVYDVRRGARIRYRRI